MSDLTKYEKGQIDEIKKWKEKEPSVVSRAIGVALEPIAWLTRKIIPKAAILAALDLANVAGKWLANLKNVKRKAGVENISELRRKELQLCDRLANRAHNWAIGIATAEGAGTGFFGIFGAPVDIPAIITMALRAIHKIGLCYGFEVKSDEDNNFDNNFILGILAASGANSVAEKVAALTTLRSIEVMIAKQTWKKMAEEAAKKQISKETAIVAVRALAKQLGINITKRRALAAIPVIGVAIGGSVNGWYIKDVGWAARRAFQERWLIDNEKVTEI